MAAPPHARVAIVGAGMSGVAAGLALANHNITDILFIEAMDHIGGRMLHTNFSGEVVELGANWIEENFDTNPIWALKDQVKPVLKGNFTQMISHAAYDQSGRVTELQLAESFLRMCSFLTKTHTMAKNMHAHAEADISVRDAMDQVGWTDPSPMEELLFYLSTDEYQAVPASDCSLYGYWGLEPEGQPTQSPCSGTLMQFLQRSGRGRPKSRRHNNNDAEPYPSDNWLVTDQRGYSVLVEYLALKYLKNVKTDPKLQLNTKVSQIDYSQNPIVITTEDSRTFTADFVISTVSVGVLQEPSLLKWTPALPDWKVDALKHIDMGTFTKIFLKFPTQFWDQKEIILYADSTFGRYPVWFNLEMGGKFHPNNTNIFLVVVTGPKALEVESKNFTVVQSEVMEVIRSMYGAHVPEPLNITFTRWHANPLTRGSYSNHKVGFTQRDLDYLKKPIADAKGVNRLWFAGEALYPDNGYVHSAYYSGNETGTLVAKLVTSLY